VQAPHDIGIRLEEARDRTWVVRAWRFGAPNHWYVIPIDSVPLAPDRVHAVSTTIKRVLDLTETDWLRHDGCWVGISLQH
jgi:hypothetical protein